MTVVAVFPVAAAAQSTGQPPALPPFTPSTKVGVTIFGDYIVTQTPKATDANGEQMTANAFNVARSYTTVTGSVTPRVSFRVTPVIARSTDGSLSVHSSSG